MDLLAEPTLRADAEAVADQKHPDQKLRIDRRLTCVAVETRKMPTDAAQVNETIN